MPRFQTELREHMRAEKSVYEAIRESGDLSDELTGKLDEELGRFVKGFNVEEESGLVGAAS